MKIKLANPRGFCAGVDRAIEIVNRALDLFGAPIYVRHEVVHNRFVVNFLRERGAVFVNELDEIPDGSIVIFSAHGVSKVVEKVAQARGLRVFDAVCPLVKKVHMEVLYHSKKGSECILVGHEGHPEVEGTMGQFDKSKGGDIYLVGNTKDVESLQVRNPDTLAYVTQTTLSMDDTALVITALKQKYPNISGPKKSDICYATQNRQDAVRQLAKECDIVFVVGSSNSSNSNRLKELAERSGVDSYLVDCVDQIQSNWVKDKKVVGITAGASAPDELVQQVINKLKEFGGEEPEELEGVKENIVFTMPKELKVVTV